MKRKGLKTKKEQEVKPNENHFLRPPREKTLKGPVCGKKGSAYEEEWKKRGENISNGI